MLLNHLRKGQNGGQGGEAGGPREAWTLQDRVSVTQFGNPTKQEAAVAELGLTCTHAPERECDTAVNTTNMPPDGITDEDKTAVLKPLGPFDTL